MGVDSNLKHDVSDVGDGADIYGRTEEKVLGGAYEETDDESSDECDAAEEEGDSRDEINEEHTLGESEESEEELVNEGEEDNLNENSEEEASSEENLDEDSEKEASSEEENMEESSDEESNNDNSEECNSKDVILSTNTVNAVKPSKQNSKQNKHIVFDEEEDFENLPLTDSLARSSKVNDEEPEESDSDAAPEEVTITVGKKVADSEDMKIKKELRRTKQKAKEDRKRKNEKNKDQQEQKRQRLETLSRKRLPEDLLKAVIVEQEKRPKQKIAIQKSEGKLKTFTDDNVSSANENIDMEGLITLKQGVHVRALKQEIKRNLTIANQAAEFRQKSLYGMKVKRMTSKELQQMKVRQEKSGKNLLVTR